MRHGAHDDRSRMVRDADSLASVVRDYGSLGSLGWVIGAVLMWVVYILFLYLRVALPNEGSWLGPVTAAVSIVQWVIWQRWVLRKSRDRSAPWMKKPLVLATLTCFLVVLPAIGVMCADVLTRRSFAWSCLSVVVPLVLLTVYADGADAERRPYLFLAGCNQAEAEYSPMRRGPAWVVAMLLLWGTLLACVIFNTAAGGGRPAAVAIEWVFVVAFLFAVFLVAFRVNQLRVGSDSSGATWIGMAGELVGKVKTGITSMAPGGGL